MLCRRQKVQRFIQWLLVNSPGYQDLDASKATNLDCLNKLPANGFLTVGVIKDTTLIDELELLNSGPAPGQLQKCENLKLVR